MKSRYWAARWNLLVGEFGNAIQARRIAPPNNVSDGVGESLFCPWEWVSTVRGRYREGKWKQCVTKRAFGFPSCCPNAVGARNVKAVTTGQIYDGAAPLGGANRRHGIQADGTLVLIRYSRAGSLCRRRIFGRRRAAS